MTDHQAPEAMTDEPPLPNPAHRGPDGTGAYFDSYTADQMRAYATQYAMWAERLRAQPTGQWGDTQYFKREIGEESDWTPCTHAEYVRLSKDPHHDTKAVTEKPTQPAGQCERDEPEENEWRDVALRFDRHRMQALWHLQAMLKDPEAHAEAARSFIKSPPVEPTQPAGQAGGEPAVTITFGDTGLARRVVLHDASLKGKRVDFYTAPQQQVGGEVVAALVLEKIDTLVATINGAHTAKSDGWREGCWAAADLVLGEIKGLLATPAPAPEPEPKAEPVPSDQAKWCEYVAGMVYGWLETLKELPPEERCTKAIAGIIGRRLWALKQAEPVRVPDALEALADRIDSEGIPGISADDDSIAAAWIRAVAAQAKAQEAPTAEESSVAADSKRGA